MTRIAVAAMVAFASVPVDAKHASQAAASVAHLRKPDRIPPIAAALLATRMGKHGDDLEWLLANVLMLNRENVEATARRIAETPRMARPQGGDSDTLNALLPARFFDLQDELATKAGQLAAAAHRRDDRAIAKAFGSLTETCVACHSSYLADAVDVEPGDQP